jgi:gliding motility-associated-like protein
MTIPVFFRVCFFVIVFIFLSISTYSQNWVTGNGGIMNDEAMDVSSDPLGNYYVTGYFNNNATFGNTTLASNGNSDIFIAKYDPFGYVQWAKHAGGSNADRANSIKTDSAGNSYVTGTFYGSAKFDNTTINSVGNSQDVFIAKYDINGNLIWVRSVGGADTETSYGITYDKDGNVIVTGQFQGVSTFGTKTLTSIINPKTGSSSFDIFTIKFDSTGTFLWVKQGSAKFDDRGLDVAVDVANNIFVVGQFSDTIQFDAVHNNRSINSGYLMKYDANGNEQWFVRLISQQTLINSIDVNQNNEILITGDYMDILRIYTIPVKTDTSSYTYNIFVAKFSNNGNLIWVDNDGSDNEVTSKSIALDDEGNAYIVGLFKCRFDEYSKQYGEGIFYSSGYRDVFVTKYSAIGKREWFKQFGSNKDDYCSGIAIEKKDKPIIAGSFENWFNVPCTSSFSTITRNSRLINGASGYCSNPNYQDFISQKTYGQKDIFITSPIDTSSNQAPFDYFLRSGSVCDQSIVKPCIVPDPYQYHICKDTIHSCSAKYDGLYVDSFELPTDSIGALYDYTWSTGSQQNNSNSAIYTSDWYTLKSMRKDGCFQDTDSVYFKVHNIPKITDSDSVNVNRLPNTDPIIICKGDTITLWAKGISLGDNVSWSGPTHTTINDSTIKTTNAGTYYVNTSGGISCGNLVSIIIDTFALTPADTLDLHIILSDPRFNGTDTIHLCPNDYWFDVKVIDSTFYDLNKDTIPFKTVLWDIQNSPPAYLQKHSTLQYHFNNARVEKTGTYTITVTLNNGQCGSYNYVVSKPFYAIVYPDPPPIIISGPANPCPGDTIILYAKGGDSIKNWTGNGILNNYNDSIKVIVPAPDKFEFYNIYSSHYDPITGCVYNQFSNFFLQSRPYPQVNTQPIDGIICPNDSALLTCEKGKSYFWYAPSGKQVDTVQNIYANVPGMYYCRQTTYDGCTQNSNFVELKDYNTPFLEVLPTNNICGSGNVKINVISSSLALIEWQAPLSGNTTSQTIYSPGTYTCRVTQCGIVTIDSISITKDKTAAFITTASDTILCPGETIVLNGNPGMDTYNWISQNNYTSTLLVTQPGSYSLETTDAGGCRGMSTAFIITAQSNKAPAPIVKSRTVCYGQGIQINATAPNTVLWYDSPSGGTVINKGYNYTTPPITQFKVYYVQTDDSVCKSDIVPIYLDIFPNSNVPPIKQKDTICSGNPLILSASVNNTNYSWTGPNGFTDITQSISINTDDSRYQGIYKQIYNKECTSSVDSFFVTIHQTPVVIEQTEDTICSGISLNLPLTSNTASNFSWQAIDNFNTTGESTTLQSTDLISDLILNTSEYFQTINYAITPISTVGNCIGNSITVNVTVYPTITNLTAIADKDTLFSGESTTIHVNTYSGYTVKWLPTEGISNPNSPNPTVSPRVSTTYTVMVTDIQGCSKSASVFIYVIESKCEPSAIFVPNTFTPNGDNNNDVLFVRGKEISELYFAVYNRWGEIVFETTDLNKGWDGIYKNKEADPVVFDWYIRAKCFNGNEMRKKGNVTLIR